MREACVYYAATSTLEHPGEESRCEASLSAEELARSRTFRAEDDRRGYVLAHAIVRSVLGRLMSSPPAALVFAVGPQGRPELAQDEGVGRLHFSLSHTRGLVACAVARGCEVGVDVEAIDQPLDLARLVPRVLTGHERAALACVVGAGRGQRYLELWTLKEAYGKATGKGLGFPLTAIGFHALASRKPRPTFAPPLSDEPERWRFELHRPGPSHVSSVALRTNLPAALTRRRVVSLSQLSMAAGPRG